MLLKSANMHVMCYWVKGERATQMFSKYTRWEILQLGKISGKYY